MGLLDGKVVFITGGGEGMGRAEVIQAAKEGAKVAYLEYKQANADGTNEAMKALGLPEPLVFMGDVTDTAFVEKAIRSTIETYGRLDCLVNNVGYCTFGLIHEYPEAEWDRTMDINLKAIYHTSRFAIPNMLKNGGGSIVNVTSTAATNPQVSTPAYSAAKAGAAMLTQVMALGYAGMNIRINSVAPGYIKTPLAASCSKEYSERMISCIPAGHMGETEEIAKAIVWLSSDEAKYITGQILGVDGGLPLYNGFKYEENPS